MQGPLRGPRAPGGPVCLCAQELKVSAQLGGLEFYYTCSFYLFQEPQSPCHLTFSWSGSNGEREHDQDGAQAQVCWGCIETQLQSSFRACYSFIRFVLLSDTYFIFCEKDKIRDTGFRFF